MVLLLLLCFAASPISAAFVPFSNCLGSSIIKSDPRLLQLVPLNVTAFFDTRNPSHNLNVTFYGNVTGQNIEADYPPPTDPSWNDPASVFGKIENVETDAPLRTTLFNSINVLSYTPYSAPPEGFCDVLQHGECPLGPSFNVSRTDLAELPAWNITYSMGAAYAFTEIIVTGRIQAGRNQADGTSRYYACINAFVTPDMGDALRALLRYLPLGILVLVGIATISAAIFSPWGTWDIFRWTSNFGRDEDVLRLVTPGFGDCLQYMQFIVLTGSLTLNYPGFYQPVVSRVGWSSLLFNESFVSGGNGSHPVADGVYQYRNLTDSGLDRITQLIGMTSPQDAWADMMVWLAVIVVAVAVLTQIGFALRWAYRAIMNVPPEDLRSKNWYFTVGNAIRVIVGFFIMPIISLSMYQFVIASQSPIYTVALAAIVLVGLLAFSVRLVFLLARYRPRSYLFDDLQTVLAYGPLYNTYCDDAATFALIPILVNFLRGIAIGALQVSGVAQIVVLAISEIVFVLTINAFRPYPSATSMNLYHTCFSIVRLITVLLSVAFVPSLNVEGGSRGWIGYVILLIHACVLVFGFFLNAIQTLIEVIARRAGAGGSSASGAARGGLVKVFGVRQLSKRMPRADNASHHSLGSNAGMLNAMDENKDIHMSRTRSRSVSISSTMLLEQGTRGARRESQQFAGNSDGQITPDAASTFSGRPLRRSGTGGIVGLAKQVEAKDPYYRPPRRNTVDLLQSPEKPPVRMNGSSRPGVSSGQPEDRMEGTSTPHKIEDFEDMSNDLNRTKTDYAVREVDFYYGVRGPALSSGTRKLKTGPADPTGPVSSATGWFKGLLGGRQKEKTKGFEVVRSARAPPPGLAPARERDLDPERLTSEPYRDIPLNNKFGSTQQQSRDRLDSSGQQRGVNTFSDAPDDELESGSPIPTEPPLLPLIDTVGGIELPSRVGSEHSKKSRNKRPLPDIAIPEVPALPRRSSRRTSSVDSTKAPPNRLSLTDPSLFSSTGLPGESSFGFSRAPLANVQPSIGKTVIISNSRDTENAIEDEENLDPHPGLPGSNIEPGRGVHTGLAHEAGLSRPESVGRVREHRASDAITHQSASSIAEGKSAEIYGQVTVAPPNSSGQGLEGGSMINPYGQPGQRASRFRD